MKLGRRSALTALLAAPAIARAQDSSAQLRDLARRATINLFPVRYRVPAMRRVG